MKRAWAARILTGFLVASVYGLAQNATMPAKPGAINYVEGNADLNGQPLGQTGSQQRFLGAGETLSTTEGRVEVLLTPGAFLRIGHNSEVRFVSNSLIDTRVEILRGEAMVEVAELFKGNNFVLLSRGAEMRPEKTGLYRITADAAPTASVYSGKAEVTFENKKVELGGGHETLLAQNLKAQKFDKNRPGELYAWSSVRSEYDAQASYAAVRYAYQNGYNFAYGPGFYWYPGFSSWAFWPGAGFAYSPFGWGYGGFYGAPVVYRSYQPRIYAGGFHGGFHGGRR